MTEGVVNSVLVRIGPFALAVVLRVWFLSCKVTVHNGEFVSKMQRERMPVIASFWHYSLVFNLFFQRKTSGTAMVSASRDGDYIAALARHFGFSSVRGSRNRGGARALRSLLVAVKGGSDAAIVADGSQGPARIAQPGALLLSSRTGAPVIPVVWSASRYFNIKTWDKTAFPKPFSHVHYFYGEAIHVPAKVNQQEMEHYRQLLENRLNSLYDQAWKKYSRKNHEE